MTCRLAILPHMELCVLGYSGAVGKEDFDAIWATLSAESNYRRHFDDLVILGPDADYSGVEYEISIEQSRKFIEVNQARPEKPKRTAFVCATEAQVYMARMFIAFVHAGGLPDQEVECFRTLAQPSLGRSEQAAGPTV